MASNEELATKFRNEINETADGKPEGTLESLLRCANMLNVYAVECFPASETVQVHFARAVAMMESAAEEIQAFLDKQKEQKT